MSVVPIFNSSILGLVLVGLFIWNTNLLILALALICVSLFLCCVDLLPVRNYYESGFWLFILSEALVFGSLLISCLYFDDFTFVNLSSPLEIPFLGCFILLGSSITITAYHHLYSWEHSWLFLSMTIILGFSFVILQLFEMNEISINLYDSSFHASSFCTVGLHFSHVIVGVVLMIFLLFLGLESVGFYRCSLVTWYWHFVDYVWLFVYTVVYIC